MAKILIVEDDNFLRKAYTNVLTRENFEVLIASDGLEGLEIAEEQEPDLILLDMLMPTLDGVGFMRRFDLKNKHPNVKVIVFSNVSNQESIDEVIELGASNYKTKAFFTPKSMVQLIKDTLSPPSADNN